MCRTTALGEASYDLQIATPGPSWPKSGVRFRAGAVPKVPTPRVYGIEQPVDSGEAPLASSSQRGARLAMAARRGSSGIAVPGQRLPRPRLTGWLRWSSTRRLLPRHNFMPRSGAGEQSDFGLSHLCLSPGGRPTANQAAAVLVAVSGYELR